MYKFKGRDDTLSNFCGTEFNLTKDADCADPGARVQPSQFTEDEGALCILYCKSTVALSLECKVNSAHT